jgi:ornithine carbamoyltransferase
MKHLLSVSEWSTRDLETVFEAARKIKAQPGRYRNALRGKTLAMIFQKPSTRTRVAFETGIFQMGGKSLYLAPNDLQLGRGETVGDTSRVLSRMVDGVIARVFAQEDLDELAHNSTIPVINALSDKFHPCQAIADYFTLREKRGHLRGLKIAYLGDGNNVANSLIEVGAKLGVKLALACPAGYEPDSDVLAAARRNARRTQASVEVVREPLLAVRGADAVYTDVWTSMGQEAEEQKRRVIFKDYQVSADVFRRAGRDAVFMHCLPAHRGDEVSAEVLDSKSSIVFDQAENRLHTQKAILYLLLQRRHSSAW